MEENTRIARAILAAGVLQAMAGGGTAMIDEAHRVHVVKSVKEWVWALERELFPPDGEPVVKQTKSKGRA